MIIAKVIFGISIGVESGTAKWTKEVFVLCGKEQTMSEKIYRVQMNSKGMPNFATAVEVADRPQGKWIKDENGDYRCSECGGCEEQFIYGTENWYGRGESKFCPSCGARMKGADDE